MKKIIILILTIYSTCIFLTSCSKTLNINNENTSSEIIESVNKMTEREFSYNPKIKFVYTDEDDYIRAITDDMVLFSEEQFGDQVAVEIPTPYIVKVDDKDKNDIKIYGDFWIYGYELFGTIFNTKNGGSYPGCYHLKDEDGKITIISKEFAEDGSDNWTSLVEICGGDEKLARSIFSHNSLDYDITRIEYAKMYARENGLKLSGIKDYGWPVILFDDISDASFLYNFYSAYFYEIRQDDVLYDISDRLNNLKKRYMTKELIEKMQDMSIDVGADMIINAQDVTDEMMDTLTVNDFGNGKLKVTYNNGTETDTIINVKIEMKNNKKTITDVYY